MRSRDRVCPSGLWLGSEFLHAILLWCISLLHSEKSILFLKRRVKINMRKYFHKMILSATHTPPFVEAQWECNWSLFALFHPLHSLLALAFWRGWRLWSIGDEMVSWQWKGALHWKRPLPAVSQSALKWAQSCTENGPSYLCSHFCTALHCAKLFHRSQNGRQREKWEADENWRENNRAASHTWDLPGPSIQRCFTSKLISAASSHSKYVLSRLNINSFKTNSLVLIII